MKGIQGLIVAIGLGVAGALFNWAYLASRSSQDATVSFVGIKEGQTIHRGEVLQDEHLVELSMPERWVGNLKDFAVLCNARGYSSRSARLAYAFGRMSASERRSQDAARFVKARRGRTAYVDSSRGPGVRAVADFTRR